MLIDAATQHWKVDAASCTAENGVVRHAPTGRSISYGDLVARVPITKTLTPDELKAIVLKKPPEYKLIGKPIARLDIPDKVDGRATFGIDVFLPGMAYAKVAYPPTREGGKHRTVDDSAARLVKGYLQTIVTDLLVAVVAETYEAAVDGRDALRIAWDLGPHANVNSPSIFLEYERRLRQEVGLPWVSTGDAAAISRAVRTHTATYTTDFAAHAQMEPLNCVARWVDDRCEIFSGTQSHSRAVAELSRGLGIPAARIRIYQQQMGGSFGRRLDSDTMVEAAAIARAAGRPIKLIRSREEDFARGYYRTPTLQVMNGWGAPLPPDVGRGLACTTFRDPKQPTWTAAIVQARVDRSSGEVRVEKITCAVDCGLVINPNGVRAQLEGGLLFGLSSALKEYGTVSHGAFDQKNFEDYPILRMDEVPEVEIHVVESTEAPTGAGEPTTTVVAPALANAIFAATGARVRHLPFLPERVRQALKANP
jgi:CO/xanthine dehydrogenase Mo-binding subunit